MVLGVSRMDWLNVRTIGQYSWCGGPSLACLGMMPVVEWVFGGVCDVLKPSPALGPHERHWSRDLDPAGTFLRISCDSPKQVPW